MIPLTHLDGREFWLSSDQILTLEKTPDTLITTLSGQHLMVREPVEAVIARVVAFRRQIAHGPQVMEAPQKWT